MPGHQDPMRADVSGLLCIDKPTGLSSHDVVRLIRRLSGIRRVGHTGTLDPLATGVLVVCLGRATRLAEYVVGRRKTYETTVRLGQATNTYDADGQIVAEKPVRLARADIEQALGRFRGPISQTPPMFSAIKRDGQPLYKQARLGKEVPRQARQVTVYELDLLAWRLPDLDLRVSCSTGTYIRSLAHDLGQLLSCGGHVTVLRRTAVGEFVAADAVSLEELTPGNWLDYLLPPDAAVQHLPALSLEAEEVIHLLHGRRLARASHHPEAPLARAYEPAGGFVGLVAAAGDSWQPKKLFHPLES